MEPVAERPPCPRCGSTRLIGRREWIQRPHLRQALPLGLHWRYWMQRWRGRHALLCYTYHCEICGHQWRMYRLEEQPEQPPRTG